jgi:hypothetical protein
MMERPVLSPSHRLMRRAIYTEVVASAILVGLNRSDLRRQWIMLDHFGSGINRNQTCK